MATRFEIVLHGDDPIALRAAGEDALNEVERLEAQLSLYRPTSEISKINARAAAGPVRIEPELFRLLQRAQRLHRETAGAFDITIAPLVRCWGFMGGTGAKPDPHAIAEARSKVGMAGVLLNEETFSVQFAREGMMLDLGAIGKGYALERAVEILLEAGIASALLHGGTSTACAIGSPPEAEFWKVAVENPFAQLAELGSEAVRTETAGARSMLAVAQLKNQSLSVSGVHGKAFVAEGRTYGHVLDPRTGEAVQGALLAAVVLPSATDTDALSTALLTVGSAGHDAIAQLQPGMRTLLLSLGEVSEEWRLETRGEWIKPSP